MSSEVDTQAPPGSSVDRMGSSVSEGAALASEISSASTTNVQDDAKNEDGSETCSPAFMYHKGNELVILKPMATADLGQATNRSTTGFIRSKLVSGVRMAAISGWVGPRNRSRSVLYNPLYTQLVRDIAGHLDFHLPPDRWDSGYKKPLEEHKGRFNACHIVCSGSPGCNSGASLTCSRKRSSRCGG